ncbi:MAG: 9-O-acetylesterase, partial [Calditrichia bacterium]|nr:9-O-acetylesterase [Calditrichia bacterium]
WDFTWFNGKFIGKGDVWDKPRHYQIPGDLIREGKNVIVVRVQDNQGGGGIWGEEKDFSLVSQKGNQISISGEWLYKVGVDLLDLPRAPQSPDDPNRPMVLYNAMIHPLIPFSVRGIIWYQGENNTHRAFQYRKLFKTMILDWREQWGQGDFPFYFVQLANFMSRYDEPGESEWAELREAQLMALELPNTGMGVAIDIGEADDIHPTNKKDVGIRLALWARNKVYGENIECSGPLYSHFKKEKNTIRIYFKHVECGLISKIDNELKGFAIAGEDKKFFWARAKIEGETVVISHPEIEKPVAVRYGWADNPECNLCNKSGLPASPFRTDKWSGLTVKKK